MTEEKIFSAERLQLARLRRGYNKTKLATLVGVTGPTITAWENAVRDPKPSAIRELAAALDFPAEFFHADMGDIVPLHAASFRSLSRMTSSQRDAALASGTMCAQLDEWITERFDLPRHELPDMDLRAIEPKAAAAYVRTGWGLGTSPISNVLQTIEANGVRVFALGPECEEVDAFSFWRDDTDTPFIVVGTHKTPERQVFDLAHELGHLVMHRNHGDLRGREQEREADQFASSFLMPREDLLLEKPRTSSLVDIVHAKHRWKVSAAALAFRLHQEHLMTDWEYHRVCVQLSKRGRANEPQSLNREQSQVLTKVFAALRAEGTSRSEIASQLHWHPADLDALIGKLAMSALHGGGEVSEPTRPSLRLVT